MKLSLASIAQYFRIALEVGLCEPEEVRDWAISVIDRMDEPPGEIIEVSWRKPLAQLISDLHEINGEADMDLVCKCLLGWLSLTLDSTDASLDRAVRQAGGIFRAAGDSELYYVFDIIEDELRLAEAGTYGTVKECRADFEKALKKYGAPPLFVHEV